MPDAAREHDPFYVGYLPLPSRDRSALRFIVPGILWVLVVVAGVFAWAQRSPGRGVWHVGRPITIEGVLRELPYPHIEIESVADHAPPGVRMGAGIVLVEVGKHGSQERCTGLDGTRVRAEGWPLERDGRLVLELMPEKGALELTGDPPQWRPKIGYGDSPLQSVEVAGEIVDVKCYLGAMKPGDAKAHKACATLCIRNGIPPTLVSIGADGKPEYTILADERNSPLGDWAHEYIGEPVNLRGILDQSGMVRVLRVARGGIQRR